MCGYHYGDFRGAIGHIPEVIARMTPIVLQIDTSRNRISRILPKKHIRELKAEGVLHCVLKLEGERLGLCDYATVQSTWTRYGVDTINLAKQHCIIQLLIVV